jgi:hypothetical protein
MSDRARDKVQTGARFTQICASQNDLFALDEDGNVHQYNFNTRTWERLVASRSPEPPTRAGERHRLKERES